MYGSFFFFFFFQAEDGIRDKLVTGVQTCALPISLRAATSSPARVFGLVDRGRIETGRRADLLLVKGDPSKDIRATRDIVGVWKMGIAIQREEVAKRAAESRKNRQN